MSRAERAWLICCLSLFLCYLSIHFFLSSFRCCTNRLVAPTNTQTPWGSEPANEHRSAKSVRDSTNERTSERICIELYITIVSSSLCVYKRDVHWLTHQCVRCRVVTHTQCVTHKHTHTSFSPSFLLFSLCVLCVWLFLFSKSPALTLTSSVCVCVCVGADVCMSVWVYVRTFRSLNFLSLAQKSIWLVAIASRTINGMRVEVSFVNKKKVFAMKRQDMARGRENGKETYTQNHKTKQRLMFQNEQR